MFIDLGKEAEGGGEKGKGRRGKGRGENVNRTATKEVSKPFEIVHVVVATLSKLHALRS